MKQDVKYRVILAIGLLLVIFPLVNNGRIDYNLRNEVSQKIIDIYGNKLYTKYYPGNGFNAGVMLFHGMGEDQNSLNLYTRFLNRAGFHVFTTDFSGHGRSSGVIPSGLNSDEILANQVLHAKTTFKQLSGLNDSAIFLLGHSMGVRAIMKATQMDTNLVNGCIIIGSAIDVDSASNDSWIKDLKPNNPACNIYILTGSWDDVQPPSKAIRLFQTLADNDTLTGTRNDYLKSDGSIISINIIKALTHTHESMSFRMASWVTTWIYNIWINPDIDNIRSIDRAIRMNISIFSLQIWLNLFEVVGIFLLLIYGQKIIKIEQEKRNEIRISEDNNANNLFNLKKFYLYKLLIWLGALLVAIIITIILIFLPISVPFFTLLFFCPLSGYGIVNIILYSIGKIPGYNGKWKPKIKASIKEMNWWSILFGILVFVIIISVFSYFFNGFLYHIFPLNIRLAWLVIFTIIALPGFYILQIETANLKKIYHDKNKETIINNFIFLLPFIIGAFVILFRGQIIFFIDALHDLILIGIIILVGNLMQQIWKKQFITALFQSFLLFFILLPRGQMALLF